MLDQIIHNLQRTPKLIDILLTGRNVDELRYKDNDESWNCFDIVRHLIVADETLWIVRAKVFLDDTLEDKTFVPFEPEKTITQYRDLQMEELISILSRKREQNIKEFLELQIHESDLNRDAIHPSIGPVKFSQLLNAWQVHDMSHISQINRNLIRTRKVAVGPWKRYFSFLRDV